MISGASAWADGGSDTVPKSPYGPPQAPDLTQILKASLEAVSKL